MRYMRYFILAMMTLLSLVALMSCEEKKTEETKKVGNVSLLDLAARANSGFSLEGEDSYVSKMIDAAGFESLKYNEFPGQPNGKKGRLLIYVDKETKTKGGVIYLIKSPSSLASCWHWYFDGAVPDSVEALELNDDGLWDVRMTVAGGSEQRFLQAESFSFAGRERGDWIATNGGSSSPPSSDKALVWRCFDGDSLTAWSSPVAPGQVAYIEVVAPFGLEEGLLTLKAGSKGQPKDCAVYVDGKKVQDIVLEPAVGSQYVKLNESVQGGRLIRLEFASTHDDAGAISIAELGIK